MDPNEAKQLIDRCIEEVSKVVRHDPSVLRTLMVPIIGGGHGLLMGEIGCAKTLTVKAISRALQLDYGRIDCTPDLFPADMVGGDELTSARTLEFRPGPALVSQILQVEEINRANPKSQSGMISVMEEKLTTVRNEEKRCRKPFIVYATQNPQESTGVFPLPEAQLDRFMVRVEIRYPDRETQEMIVRKYPTAEKSSEKLDDIDPVLSEEHIFAIRDLVNQVTPGDYIGWICDACTATRPDGRKSPVATRYGQRGAGPRALRDLTQSARAFAVMDGQGRIEKKHLKEAFLPSLRHRVTLNREGRNKFERDIDAYLNAILKEV